MANLNKTADLLIPIVGVACAYEAFAIFTDVVPTLSEVSAKRPWLIGVLVGGLAWHLATP